MRPTSTRGARRLGACALLAALLGCSSPFEGVQRREPGVELSPCLLSREGSARRVRARCGQVRVPEDRSAPGGRELSLRVAVVPAESPEPQPEPVLFLAGGPGEAASEAYVDFADVFSRIRDRDIVLVDQRGTGASNPLECHSAEAGPNEAAEPDAEAWAESCLASLDADVTQYTTVVAMQDLDDVRRALGYDRVNLYGISYGTRAALTYLRYHGEQVRAVVLDGVAPPDRPLGFGLGRYAQRALDLVAARCRADPACSARFPSFGAELTALLERLAEAPARVTFAHPRTGEPHAEEMTAEALAWTVRLLLYQPETSALLPLLVHDAHARNDYARLAAQATLVSDSLQSAISRGMNITVICSEDAPHYPAAGDPDVASALARFNAERRWIEEVCRFWPRGEIPPDFTAPVSSQAPVLLLSGESDPVTPPAHAEHAARSLDHARHVVVPGHGHGMGVRGCMPEVIGQLFDRGTTEDLDLRCVDAISPIGFFLTFSGPNP